VRLGRRSGDYAGFATQNGAQGVNGCLTPVLLPRPLAF